jgi:aldose sugar dehydrogenase
MQKKLLVYLSAILSIVYSTGCANNNASSEKVTSEDSSQLSPVETQKANTDHKPAFEGQTRIAGVKTTTAFRVEKIADSLGNPWAVVPLPDSRLLITIKSGYMEIHNADGTLAKKITGFPNVLDSGQAGILDVALDTGFANNKIIYWTFAEKYKGFSLTSVAKGKLNEAKGIIENPVVIFRATPALNSLGHYGSRVVVDKYGNLFVSSGERAIPEGRAQAQKLNAGIGKIFKITTDGKPAAGNPFTGQAAAMPEIYAYGIRNPQGLDINPATGELWESEFGPVGGDEIDIIRAGKNYGWPVITYGLEDADNSKKMIGEGIQQKDSMEQPIYYWDPVVSPSGISFYKGNTIPEWQNNLFVACLSGSHIDRLVIVNNKVVGEERLLSDLKERFRDVACDNGMLYAVTDAGNLYRISKQ